MRPKQPSPSLSALRMLLTSEVRKGEAELQKLGRSKRAWRAIRVLSPREEGDFHQRYWHALARWHNYTERHRRAFRTWLDARPVRPPEDSIDALWAEWWLKHARRSIPRILQCETIPSGWVGGEEFGELFRSRESQLAEGESAVATTRRRSRRKARAGAQSATLQLAWLKVHGATVDKLLGPQRRVTTPARVRRTTPRASLRESRESVPGIGEQRARERKEHLLATSWNETTQEWRNAQRAALADAALRTLDDPLSIFAAGVSLGQSYLAEVHARQSRPNLAERAVLDAHSSAGSQTHRSDRARRVKLAEAIVYSAAQRLARHQRGPDSTARLLEMNEELQRIVKKLRGEPYAFGRLRQIVRDPAAAHSHDRRTRQSDERC
jgi:hypothetical protein